MDPLSAHIKNLREDFMKGTLNESEMPPSPADFFSLWMQQAVAAQTPEVQAMTLCTASLEGKPTSRVVYLREFEENRFTFYTNYLSRKGRQLQENPFAAISFFWPELERQIHIEGKVQMAPITQSNDYFNSRPVSSQIGAWASNQSQPIASREFLEQKVEQLTDQFKNGPVPRPEHWGGYTLVANRFEFWQGRKSRLHDRIEYQLKDATWVKSRLSP